LKQLPLETPSVAALKDTPGKSTDLALPPLPSATANTKINGTTTASDLQRQVQSACTSQGCRERAKARSSWTDKQRDDAQRSAMAPALKRFNDADSIRPWKFPHDKLPLNTFPHKQNPMSDPKCPTCRETDEGCWRFWERPHKSALDQETSCSETWMTATKSSSPQNHCTI
jgi:hypothetical protein